MALTSTAAGTSYGERQLRAAVPFLTWAVYFLFFGLHIVVRSYGDDLLPWRSVERLDLVVAGTNLPAWLQDHLYSGETTALERVTTGAHLAWFAFPVIVGAAITIRCREQLVPYLGWVTAGWFAADLFFLLFPVRPPWMESSEVQRILLTNGWLDYTGEDTNPVAAFPSLHVLVPALIGLFLWSRWPAARWLAWVSFGFATLIGFSVVYLGEHWLVDVGAGAALAVGLHRALMRVRRLDAINLSPAQECTAPAKPPKGSATAPPASAAPHRTEPAPPGRQSRSVPSPRD